MWDLGCISKAEAVGHGRKDDVIPWDDPGSLDGAALAPGCAHVAHRLLCCSTCSRFTTAGGLCSSQLLMVQNAGDSPDIHCRWLATAWAHFEEEMTNQSWLCMERWWQNTALPTWTNRNVLALGSQVPPGVKGLSILAIFCATHCMVAS